MAMVCDSCGTKFARDAGQSTLHVSPPRPDFKLFHALATAGQSYEPRDPVDLDLCLQCTSKALVHLGLSTEICEVPQMPPEPADPSDPPNAGALTDEDLRKLGLIEPGTSGE